MRASAYLCAVVAPVATAAIAAPAPATLGASAAAQPRAPAAQQTHPRVHPTAGTRHTTFVVTLTARDDLGVRDVVQSDYSIEAQNHRHGCVSGASISLTRARKGQRLTIHMTAPGSGWCRGRYGGVVLFERGPYCPKPAPGKPPRPCPLFASRALDVGRFAFRVR